MPDKPKKIYLGADHKGYELKNKIIAWLKEWGYETTDFGTNSDESVDYPDFASQVADAVAGDVSSMGIVVCWTGNGVNMTVNKNRKVRGAYALNEEMAQLAREHNDANVLALGSHWISEEQAKAIVRKFLDTEFAGGRHERRVKKFSG